MNRTETNSVTTVQGGVGLSLFHTMNKQGEFIALNRQGTQQHRPESPTVTPLAMRVNARVVRLYTPVSPSVPELEGIYATGSILL